MPRVTLQDSTYKGSKLGKLKCQSHDKGCPWEESWKGGRSRVLRLSGCPLCQRGSSGLAWTVRFQGRVFRGKEVYKGGGGVCRGGVCSVSWCELLAWHGNLVLPSHH